MINSVKKTIIQNIQTSLGWRTKRHIVIFESDDWGAIRMPSNEIRELLRSKFVRFSNYGYDDVDTLASKEDLESLFDVLLKYKDCNGNHPKITANVVVANPIFNKIKASNFQEYFYEPFTETLERVYPNDNVFGIWQNGIKEKIFIPQFHGREHVNVQMWLSLLNNRDSKTLSCFDYGVYSHLLENKLSRKLLHAYNITDIGEIPFVQKSIIDGLDLFCKIFGYRSLTAIAPSFTWDDYVEETYSQNGVIALQGSFVQSQSILYGKKKKRHYLGQSNKYNQFYLTRNALFEPSQNGGSNVESCLQDIERAFFWKKPAIISSHRLNYIGTLDQNNRKKTLLMLDSLLSIIQKKYGDVEFMSSDELVKAMLNKEL